MPQKAHIFAEVPDGYPDPTRTTVVREIEGVEGFHIGEGQVRVKTLALSVDPYMRNRMRETLPASTSAIPSLKVPGNDFTRGIYYANTAAFVIGESVTGFGVGVIEHSNDSQLKPGDHVYGGQFPHQETFVASGSTLIKIDNLFGLPWSVYLGAAGMPGQTAWMGWMEYSKAKPGEVVYVSGGAGPVGSMVVQLAKRAGLTVIASAGSQEKLDLLKSIGADVVFNYKDDDMAQILQEHGPIDIFWDNTGGAAFEAALNAANIGARFLICGTVSAYNSVPYHVKNMILLHYKEIQLSGFLWSTLFPKYCTQFYAEVPQQLASGELHYQEAVYDGLTKASQALCDVQMGKNLGKAVVIL